MAVRQSFVPCVDVFFTRGSRVSYVCGIKLLGISIISDDSSQVMPCFSQPCVWVLSALHLCLLRPLASCHCLSRPRGCFPLTWYQLYILNHLTFQAQYVALQIARKRRSRKCYLPFCGGRRAALPYRGPLQPRTLSYVSVSTLADLSQPAALWPTHTCAKVALSLGAS